MSGEQAVIEILEKMQRLRNEDGELLFPHLDRTTLLQMGEMLRNPPDDFRALHAYSARISKAPELFQLLRDAYWFVVHTRHPGLQ